MRRAPAAVATVMFIAAMAMLAGCATAPPPAPPVVRTPPPVAPPPSPPAPRSGTGDTVGTTASGGTIRVNPPPATTPAWTTPTVVDSAPSPDAINVLQTIPEPLATTGAMPAGAVALPTAPVAVPRASSTPLVVPSAADSTAASPIDADVDSAGVPIPEPTSALGDRPGSLASAALPESLATPPAASATPPAASAPPDSCWRVQLAAPPERDRADRLAEAARSQLTIAVVVEREAGLYKVRTRDCLPGLAADQLRRRALATGFDGAFRFLKKTP